MNNDELMKIRRIMADLARESNLLKKKAQELRHQVNFKCDDVSIILRTYADCADIITEVEIPAIFTVFSKKRISKNTIRMMLAANRPDCFCDLMTDLLGVNRNAKNFDLLASEVFDLIISIRMHIYVLLVVQFCGMKNFVSHGCIREEDRIFLTRVFDNCSDYRVIREVFKYKMLIG